MVGVEGDMEVEAGVGMDGDGEKGGSKRNAYLIVLERYLAMALEGYLWSFEIHRYDLFLLPRQHVAIHESDLNSSFLRNQGTATLPRPW